MSNSRPDDINRQLADAQRLIASKSYTEAEKILLDIVTASPANTLAWHELGNARYRNKAYAKAVEAFQRRYGIEPDNPIANYSLGVALLELGRVDEARMYLKRALEIKPDFHQAKQRLDRLGSTSETHDKGRETQIMDTPQRSSNVRADIAPSGNTPPESLSNELQRGRADPGKLLWSGHQMRRIYWRRTMFAVVLMVLGVVVLITIGGGAAVGKFFFWLTGGGLGRSLYPPSGVVGVFFFWLTLALSIPLLISGVVSAPATQYRIYERRVDFERGVFRRSADSVWFFEVTNVTYEQPLSLLLAGTAKIALQTERTQLTYITGIAGAPKMKQMWEEMRDSILAQRRDIKGIWI